MIRIIPNRYFSAVWSVHGTKSNWLAAVYKDKNGPWTYVYRFRYFKDDKLANSEDERSWYKGELSGDIQLGAVTKLSPKYQQALAKGEEALACAMMDEIGDMIAQRMGAPLEKVPLKTDDCEIVLAAITREKNTYHIVAISPAESKEVETSTTYWEQDKPC